MNALVRRFTDDESGATAIEYGLIAAVMGAGMIAVFTIFGGSLGGLFNWVRDQATGAMDNAGI